jgi:hypothetical protein
MFVILRSTPKGCVSKDALCRRHGRAYLPSPGG